MQFLRYIPPRPRLRIAIQLPNQYAQTKRVNPSPPLPNNPLKVRILPLRTSIRVVYEVLVGAEGGVGTMVGVDRGGYVVVEELEFT